MTIKHYSILGAIIGAFLALFILKLFNQIKVKRRFEKAKNSEKQAVILLERHGFRITDIQKTKTYTLFVDNKPHEAMVRADMIAKKNNKTYVVEVKSGKKAPSPRSIATRRQLLEYYLAYRPDGLLLVDMEKEKIRQIRYSFIDKSTVLKHMLWFVVIFFLGAIVGFLTRGG